MLMTADKQVSEQPEISEDGFVIADGVKICRIGDGGVLLFYDKNRHRALVRGSANVGVLPDELLKLLADKAKVETK